MPLIVYNFLESHVFSGKIVFPFCTHGGSGLSGTVRTISSLLPSADVRNGLAIRGTTAQNNRSAARAEVEEYLSREGF